MPVWFRVNWSVPNTRAFLRNQDTSTLFYHPVVVGNMVKKTVKDELGTMPVDFIIDIARKLVVSTWSGEIKESDFFEVASRIKAHPDFDPCFSELLDFSGATGVSVSTFELQAIASQESIYNRSSMHVVIVPQPHLFGLARMYQVYAEQTKPNVVAVRSMEEACAQITAKKRADIVN